MKTNGNDAAFGKTEKRLLPDGDGAYIFFNAGLTKREYFAAMAMQGLCAKPVSDGRIDYTNLTTSAVIFADALIERLNGE